MSERSIKINTNSKSNRCHTPEYKTKKGQNKTNQLLKNQKKIMNKNQSENFFNENDVSTDINIEEQLSDRSNSGIEQTNILSLNKKIISQQNDISYLKTRLENYDNSINEISRLNKELSKMKKSIKAKNEIISEFQKITEITKTKFENYINANKLQIKNYENTYGNLPEIQKENENLNQKLISLQKQNKELKEKYKEIESKNKNDLDKVKEDMNNIKKNYENLVEENGNIKKENIHNNREIEKIRQKLSSHEKNEVELDKINKKYSELENQITEKNNKIKNLEKMSKNIEDKIKISEENHKKVLNDQSNLKEKLKQLQDLCNQYEVTFQKIKKFNNKNTPQHLELNENNINYQYNTLNNNQTKRRIFFNQDYKKKIDSRVKIRTLNNENLSLNYNYSTKNNRNSKRYTINNEYNTNQRLGFLTQRDNQINFSRNINNIDLNYIRNSNKILDKSFEYSNYLLHNLKNTISELNFDYKY